MQRVATQIRLEEWLYNKIKAISTRELRTMNAQMEIFLREAVAEYEKGTHEVTDSEIAALEDEE